MNKYDKFQIDKVKTDADIRDFVTGCNKKKLTQEVECPFCGKKKFYVDRRKGHNSATCWACHQGFSNPVEAVMHYRGYNQSHFIQALEETAQQAGLYLTPLEQQRSEAVKAASEASRQTFCSAQLEASGLTLDDVMASVIESNQELLMSPFRKGRVNESFRADPSGDDMLIYYYDLHGRPMQYKPKNTSAMRPYIRVRWSNPAIHLSANGDEMKYQTPPGASCRIYIPERIRQAYKSHAHIETLFVQEGEKKAEKACKHGMPSIGIQGIFNIGNAKEGLVQDIQDLAKACSIRNIVLIMDSDWNELSKKLIIGDSADKRPNLFSRAVIKFKSYMNTMHNVGLSVDVWWGHVNANEAGDKGIDDLLCGTLKGRESELVEEIDRVMHTHNGVGTLLNIHKITASSDAQIRDFWHLNDYQSFYDLHHERLAEVETFKLGKIRYKSENGKLVQVSRYSSEVDIFSIEKDSKDNDKVVFNMLETLRFLNAYGFFRLRNSDDPTSGYDFIHIDDGIIDRSVSSDIRDFVFQYILSNCQSVLVQREFATKLDVWLADKKLERLDIRSDQFNNFEAGVQRTYYNNGQVEITADDIVPGKPISNVWRSRIVPRKFRREPIIKSIQKADDTFFIEYTPAASRCEFLTYLINTSNNIFPHDRPREITEQEAQEWLHHLVNKITTIGYLLCDYKYASERKAVIIQDHLMSEVGQSHGGAGKSIVGNAIAHILNQFFIDGKSVRKDDQFMLSGVTKITRNIFIDDVKTNFDFDRFFALVTGDMTINPKGKDRYNIPVSESPKFLITTNHAINRANEDAVRRRISYMEFSHWYNPEHTLVDDFHHMFFDDWDDEQWNLFDNLMAECVMFYLRSFEQQWAREGEGAIPPPMRNIELRTLRQQMSEVLFQWAEEYFDPTGIRLNERLNRKVLIDSFLEYAGGPAGHGVTRTNFKQKIIAYCKFKGYDFNINRPNSEKTYYSDWKPLHPDESFIGDDDKSGGVEYFTVYSPEYEKTKKPF